VLPLYHQGQAGTDSIADRIGGLSPKCSPFYSRFWLQQVLDHNEGGNDHKGDGKSFLQSGTR